MLKLRISLYQMTAKGTKNDLGQSSTDRVPNFEIPTTGQAGGSNKDMGSLALMLVANWFINGRSFLFLLYKSRRRHDSTGSGETVLIDGGVSQFTRACTENLR